MLSMQKPYLSAFSLTLVLCFRGRFPGLSTQALRLTSTPRDRRSRFISSLPNWYLLSFIYSQRLWSRSGLMKQDLRPFEAVRKLSPREFDCLSTVEGLECGRTGIRVSVLPFEHLMIASD